MPLPLILGVGAAVAGLVGVGSGIHGATKMKEANDRMESIQRKHENNMKNFERENKITNTQMDKLGKLELEILKSFKKFSDVFEEIKNKPSFEEYSKEGVKIPKYTGEDLKEVSVGASVLLGGIGGAGLGTLGGFAAAGATTAAVMALGTASTGTAIASLSGAAATNATLAALGGGAIAAGGGGIALGTTILGAATLGVGLLVGGIIFGVAGENLSDKVDEAERQMLKAQREINEISSYLQELTSISQKYYSTLSGVNSFYQRYLQRLENNVYILGKTDWNRFTYEEKRVTENTVLLVGLLYNMCKVKLVLKGQRETDINRINKIEINKNINDANKVIETIL